MPGPGRPQASTRSPAAEPAPSPPPVGDRYHVAALIQRAFKQPSVTSAGSKPFPGDFPALTSEGFVGGNMSGMESQVTLLERANREILQRLRAYGAGEAGRELERRMLAERGPALKLLLASQAAVRGSEAAARLLLASTRSTDYLAVRNSHDAIKLALQACQLRKERAPAWLAELAMVALADGRQVTGLRGTSFSSGTRFRVSYLADEHGDLALALGRSRSPRAVPFLIKRVHKTEGARGPVMALGEAGDPRAVPALIACVERAARGVKWSDGFGVGDRFKRPVIALGELRAREAVPALLRRIEYPCAVRALRKIGDRRAVPALDAMVKASGRVFVGGVEKDPGLAKARLAVARIALASLDRPARVRKLCALAGDMSLGPFERREVLWALAERPDPGAIPCLLRAARQDPSGAVVDSAIQVLSVFRYPAAVSGLIGCFEADFEGKHNWKYAYTSQMFRQHVAESLQALTGKRFGANKQRWITWWRDKAKGKLPLKRKHPQPRGR